MALLRRNAPFQRIEVNPLHRLGSAALDHAQASFQHRCETGPRRAKALLDEARVVVWDYTWKSGAPVSATYTRDTVAVWLSVGKIKLTPKGGSATTIDVAPGQVRRYARGDVESVEVVDGSPREMIFAFK